MLRSTWSLRAWDIRGTLGPRSPLVIGPRTGRVGSCLSWFVSHALEASGIFKVRFVFLLCQVSLSFSSVALLSDRVMASQVEEFVGRTSLAGYNVQ